MAVTTQNSTEYANSITTPVTKQAPSVLHGRKRIALFTHVQSGAGDAGSLALLAKLPAGVVRVLGAHINIEALGASRTLDLGHGGYTDADGAAVSADRDAFFADVDVSSAVDAFKRAGGASAAGVSIESKEGFVVSAQVNDASFPDTKKLNGWIEYVID